MHWINETQDRIKVLKLIIFLNYLHKNFFILLYFDTLFYYPYLVLFTLYFLIAMIQYQTYPLYLMQFINKLT